MYIFCPSLEIGTWRSRSARCFDERQGGEDPFGVGEVLARRGVGWSGVRGPDLVRVEARSLCSSTRPGRDQSIKFRPTALP
jgi:hypothetical protein